MPISELAVRPERSAVSESCHGQSFQFRGFSGLDLATPVMEAAQPGGADHDSSCWKSSSANPWEQDSRCVSNIRGCLILAEQMGLNALTLDLDSRCAQMLAQSSSSKVIAAQKELTNHNKALHQVKLKIARLSQEKHAAQLFHHDVVEKRIAMVNQMCTDLDTVLKNMDMLIHRLQKPFVGDHIKVDAAYHKFAKEVFTQMVPTLNDLAVYLDNITWAANNDFSSSQLEPLLVEVQSLAASMQTSHHMLSQMKNGVEILTHHKHSSYTDLDVSHESTQPLPSSPSSSSASGNNSRAKNIRNQAGRSH